MDISMSKVHQTTYNAIFQHPIAHNLQWHDVRSMLDALAEVTEEHNGNLKFTRHGEVLVLHPPKHKDLSDSTEVMQIRHFLERSSVPIQATLTEHDHLLVVINHRETRIYSGS
jgi:prephenate dehydrogenase